MNMGGLGEKERWNALERGNRRCGLCENSKGAQSSALGAKSCGDAFLPLDPCVPAIKFFGSPLCLHDQGVGIVSINPEASH